MATEYAFTFSVRHKNPQSLTAYYRPSYFSFFVRGCCENQEKVKAIRTQIFQQVNALKSSPKEPSFSCHNIFVLQFHISATRKDLKNIQEKTRSILNQNGIPYL